MYDDLTGKLAIIETQSKAESDENEELYYSYKSDYFHRNQRQNYHNLRENGHTIYVDEKVVFPGFGKAIITMEKPVVIQSGIKYQIVIEQDESFPYLATTNKYIIMDEKVEPGIIVTFSKRCGLVQEMKFSQI